MALESSISEVWRALIASVIYSEIIAVTDVPVDVLRKHQTKIANTGPWQPPLRFLRYLCCRLLPRCHDLESILKIPIELICAPYLN